MAYCLAAYSVLQLTYLKGPRLQNMLTIAEGAGLACLTMTVAYARVYLGYHTTYQVWMGGVTGLFFGAIWTWSCLRFLRRHGLSILERLPFLLSLGLSSERATIPDGQKQS
jgi:membrane-associated phospholipid phosphatase